MDTFIRVKDFIEFVDNKRKLGAIYYDTSDDTTSKVNIDMLPVVVEINIDDDRMGYIMETDVRALIRKIGVTKFSVNGESRQVLALISSYANDDAYACVGDIYDKIKELNIDENMMLGIEVQYSEYDRYYITLPKDKTTIDTYMYMIVSINKKY